MSVKSDIQRILRSYTLRTQSPEFEFDSFVAFLEKYVPKHEQELPDLAEQMGGIVDTLIAVLLQFAEEGACLLQGSGGAKPQRFTYVQYYHERLFQEMERVRVHPESPFPNEDSLRFNLPTELINAVDIKTDFIRYIGKSKGQPPELVRVMYPDGIKSMLVNTPIIDDKLLEICFLKTRNYLRSARNASYMQHKLLGIFRQREKALRDMFNSILTRPDQVLAELDKPTEFTFHFWAQISSLIIKEFAQKKDRLEEEHGFCQAAYIIGFFTVYKKGIAQKERELEVGLKAIDLTLDKVPYAYTIQEIYNIKDSKGVALTKKIDYTRVLRYLEERSTHKEGSELPELLRIMGEGNREYFVKRPYVTRILANRVHALPDEYRGYFVDRWYRLLKEDRDEEAMTDDDAFQAAVEARVRGEDPMLAAILNYPLLFLLKQDSSLSPLETDTLTRLLDTRDRKLVPLAGFLGLSRKDLLREARLLLPFWQAVPILRHIVRLLSRVLVDRPDEKGRKRTKKADKTLSSQRPDRPDGLHDDSPARLEVGDLDDRPSPVGAASGDRKSQASRRAQQARFREAVQALKTTVAGSGDLKRQLAESMEEWNFLIDEGANRALVEDVNSLVRDFIRRLKITARLIPPDSARIRNLARELSEHEALSRITRKNALRRYVELYMIDVLSRV